MEFINMKKIQAEIKEWQYANFHQNTPIDCLLGVVEELGAIARTILKYKIQIREIKGVSHPVIWDHIKNKLADLVIFLIGFCVHNDWDFAEIVEQRWKEVKDRDWQRFPKNGVSE